MSAASYDPYKTRSYSTENKNSFGSRKRRTFSPLHPAPSKDEPRLQGSWRKSPYQRTGDANSARNQNSSFNSQKEQRQTLRRSSKRVLGKQGQTNLRLRSGKGKRGLISSLDTILRSRGFARIFPFIIMLIAIIALLILGSCVSSCIRNKTTDQSPKTSQKKNPIDSRIQAGASEELSRALKPKLDEAQAFEKIASQAASYKDLRFINLALREPAAAPYIASLPQADKKALPYKDAAKKGVVPKLFCWDARWGYVDYAGLPLGLSGSGPVSFAMAYIGLTGKNDKTPADFAALAEKQKLNTGNEYTAISFFVSATKSFGLSGSIKDANQENLLSGLTAHSVVLLQLKANTISPEPHWALAVALKENSTVVLYDPTSAIASQMPHSAESLVKSAAKLVLISSDIPQDTQDDN